MTWPIYLPIENVRCACFAILLIFQGGPQILIKTVPDLSISQHCSVKLSGYHQYILLNSHIKLQSVQRSGRRYRRVNLRDKCVTKVLKLPFFRRLSQAPRSSPLGRLATIRTFRAPICRYAGASSGNYFFHPHSVIISHPALQDLVEDVPDILSLLLQQRLTECGPTK